VLEKGGSRGAQDPLSLLALAGRDDGSAGDQEKEEPNLPLSKGGDDKSENENATKDAGAVRTAVFDSYTK